MPSFGKVKPISIVAFLLTCLSCLLAVLAISLSNWWSVNRFGDRAYNGVWSMQICDRSGVCRSGSATQLPAGQEALFVSKVFTTFTVLLSVVALVLHIIYAVIRMPVMRTVAIFMLGSAALFGILSIFVFVGFYNTVKAGDPSLGAAFYLFLFTTLIIIAAGILTTLASIKKAADFRLSPEEVQ